MLQIAYISTSRTPIDQPLLDAILLASRRNNDRNAVTGLLVAGGKRFLQVLEGPEAAVAATFARIEADPRHLGFVLLARRPVAAPAFGSWAMAYQAGGNAAAAGPLADAVERLTAGIADPNLRAQFSGFARLHSQAA